MKKVFLLLTIVSLGFLAGCQDSSVAPQAVAKPKPARTNWDRSLLAVVKTVTKMDTTDAVVFTNGHEWKTQSMLDSLSKPGWQTGDFYWDAKGWQRTSKETETPTRTRWWGYIIEIKEITPQGVKLEVCELNRGWDDPCSTFRSYNKWFRVTLPVSKVTTETPAH